jgi:hypothetical protein
LTSKRNGVILIQDETKKGCFMSEKVLGMERRANSVLNIIFCEVDMGNNG